MDNPEKINRFITDIKSAEGLETFSLDEARGDPTFSKEEKRDIKNLTGKDTVGRGQASIILKNGDATLTGINLVNKKSDLLYEEARLRGWDKTDPAEDYEKLNHRTFRQKNRYYTNKILTILFPDNFAKLHAVTAGISLSLEDEKGLKETYKDVPDEISSYTMDKREMVEKPKFWDAAFYKSPKSKFKDITQSLKNSNIGLHYDVVETNTIKSREGHEVYIDDAFLEIKTSGDIDKIAAFMLSENIKNPGTYSQNDMDTVKGYADRLKVLTEEYKKNSGEDIPLFKQL